MMKGECNIIENYSKDEYCKTFAVTDVYLKLHQIFFKKTGQSRPLFRLFLAFFKQFNVLQQINVKNVMSIQYTVPGFEPTTIRT